MSGQATLLANHYVEHPVIDPCDDAPSGGNLGNTLAVPFFAVAALGCLLFPVRVRAN
ncbi:hypothetical protein ABZ890_17990 [Streptomyces sp. NPDC046984]|uniref:hypothetical protein n=1 Tax=Streptomyces sp. NPDC046984 TaxID=3155138 RepID=UPI0033CDA9B5